MSQTFKEFLAETRPDADTVHQAARYYLAQRVDDLPEDDMAAQLRGAVDPVRLDALRDELAADSAALEAVDLAVLACAWEEPGEADRVRAAFAGAKGKLPVLEVGILATVAMYGMWLVATGGIKKQTRVVRRKPDGSREEFEEVEFHGPPPVARLFKFLTGLGG